MSHGRYILSARCIGGGRVYLSDWHPHGFSSWGPDVRPMRFTLRKARHVRRVCAGRMSDVLCVAPRKPKP